MLIELFIGIVKLLANGLLVILFPFHLFNFVLPVFILDPIIDVIARIVGVLIWLFGREVYSFFVFSALMSVSVVPIIHLSFFIFHFVHKVKGFFR